MLKELLNIFKKDELIALSNLCKYAKLSKWLADNGYITDYQCRQTYKYAYTGTKKVERRYQ